jgi:hypothetical protein
MPGDVFGDLLDVPILSQTLLLLESYSMNIKRKLHRKDDKERLINMCRTHRGIRDAKRDINQWKNTGRGESRENQIRRKPSARG